MSIAGLRVTSVISAIEPGGAEKVAVEQCRLWSEWGAKVTLVTLHKADRTLPVPPHVHLIPMEKPMRPSRGRARVAVDNVAKVTDLRRSIRDSSPHVVVSHVDQTNVLTLLACRKLNVPVVVVEHVDIRHHVLRRPWPTLMRLSYRWARRIVIVSEGMRGAYPAALQSRIVVIPNPVHVPPLDRKPRLGGADIVGMGRLTYQKGFDILIRAVALLSLDYPDVTLTIWGSGPEAESLRAMAHRLGIAERFHLPGFADEPAKVLLDASVFAFPSRYEGFGLALAEAMALGLPVVAADCQSGPGEFIENGINGLLVPTEDPTALASALGRIIDDPSLARSLSRHAVRVRERFAAERIAQLWVDLLSRVAREGGRMPNRGETYSP